MTPPRFAEVSDIDRTFDPSQFDLPSDVRAILARPPAPAVETYASFRDDSVAGIPSLASTDASAVIEVNGHDIEVETTGVEQVEEALAASADDGMSEGSRGLGKLGFADQLRGFEDDASNTFFPDEFEAVSYTHLDVYKRQDRTIQGCDGWQ